MDKYIWFGVTFSDLYSVTNIRCRVHTNSQLPLAKVKLTNVLTYSNNNISRYRTLNRITNRELDGREESGDNNFQLILNIIIKDVFGYLICVFLSFWLNKTSIFILINVII